MAAKVPYPFQDPLDKIQAKQRCAKLSPKQQAAIAAACAERVLPFFRVELPERATVLSEALGACWGTLEGHPLPSPDALWDRLNAAIPDSEDISIGPGLPAGEAVIYAFKAVCNPSPTDATEAIVSAYTAVEMAEDLRENPVEDGRTGRMTGAMLALHADLLQYEQPVQEFLGFVDRALTALEHGTDPLLLRS